MGWKIKRSQTQSSATMTCVDDACLHAKAGAAPDNEVHDHGHFCPFQGQQHMGIGTQFEMTMKTREGKIGKGQEESCKTNSSQPMICSTKLLPGLCPSRQLRFPAASFTRGQKNGCSQSEFNPESEIRFV